MKAIKSFKILAILLGFVLCFSFTGCGDDEPDDPTGSTDNYTRVTYGMELSNTWYQYFDINITFTDVRGNSNTYTATANWTYDEFVKTAEAGTTFNIKVEATPKAGLTFSDNESYRFSAACYMRVYTTTATGTMTSKLYDNSTSPAHNYGGSGLTSAHTIYTDTYTVSK